jgi:hypothetical protein
VPITPVGAKQLEPESGVEVAVGTAVSEENGTLVADPEARADDRTLLRSPLRPAKVSVTAEAEAESEAVNPRSEKGVSLPLGKASEARVLLAVAASGQTASPIAICKSVDPVRESYIQKITSAVVSIQPS